MGGRPDFDLRFGFLILALKNFVNHKLDGVA